MSLQLRGPGAVHAPRRVPVVTAADARDLDARTIATLPDSYTLMHRAASVAAAWLEQRDERCAAVYVGPGNNGGDGWLIAGLLRDDLGWRITLHSAGDPRTPDARRARGDAQVAGPFAAPSGSEPLILDALLGTGAAGAPRGEVAAALEMIRAARAADSAPLLVAIDIPTALNATTGEDHGALAADVTLTFGSIKRGQLLRRDLTGEVHALDIGLVDAPPAAPRIVDAATVAAWIPPLAIDAYKGTRGRLAIVGGERGMAGAVILAARGAHASGAGMVRADVASESLLALQIAVPFATAHAWDATDWSGIDTRWPRAMVIGPGLDGSAHLQRARILALLHAFGGPVVLDAGALTAFRWRAESDIDEIDVADGTEADPLDALRHALRGRPAVLTPHIGEFERLFAPGTAPRDRFDAPAVLARRLGATVLLKGVPTVIASPDGTTLISAAGNPALAMGGSGDLLSGIAGALLAQGMAPLHAGAAAAWVHGTAADLATTAHGSWRGVTMELLLHEVSTVWPRLFAHTSLPPSTVLELPAVPAR
ncbi:MAG: NAD(P)H-hydrate dehydratase [Gemmatimonadaceae bacterium]|nr:NAD(P)H-hydrate dehydratase [Gemmatimonadaceae bacterium]